MSLTGKIFGNRDTVFAVHRPILVQIVLGSIFCTSKLIITLPYVFTNSSHSVDIVSGNMEHTFSKADVIAA